MNTPLFLFIAAYLAGVISQSLMYESGVRQRRSDFDAATNWSYWSHFTLFLALALAFTAGVWVEWK